ncbi:MAG: AraC family transcriptional regulator [Herbinix sp.]|jgi:AraC family transcriptional regulator|nr:AraC family transcriptional regulator [Herbinix sp.]
MWQTVAMNGTIERLLPLMDSEPMGILGVSACNERDNWNYFIAVASSKPTEGVFEEYTIEAATWAIFYGEGKNPNAIQELEKSIITEWLPTSGYEYANAPDIEVYLNADSQDS